MIEFKKDDLRNEILATDGNLLIMGGPGSGKTTIALFKAKELTANSNTIRKSQKILFLSFARATISRVEEQAGELIPQELKKQIDEFRVAVFHMNNDDTQGDLYDITDEVENRYESLRKVPEVNAYLEAELDVCRMLQQVQSQFRNGIDLNIPNV